MIHGGPDWDHSYLCQPLGRLASSKRLLLPDLRGCGRSARGLPIHRYHPDAAVADLLTILDSFAITMTDVLGFSYGGLLAQRLAAAAPQRIRRMIIASSSIIPMPANAYDGWAERDALLASEAAVWSDPTLSGPKRPRAAAFASARANVWRADALPELLKRLRVVWFSSEWDRARRAGVLPSARLDDAVSVLIRTEIPILLLHGRYDMVFPPMLAEQAAAQMPNATAVVLDDAGHMAHIDQPEVWLDAIANFLE
ncbi:alpha/beta fold hydrolase [Nocardia yunnanensis]|uniref:alpha/beta fold hydrolase n=1 Tax=Nocardia yunnanensis TaxID=2382165 RepID=UPI001FE480E8|nr:alpha/beta hydrolase [Nocardia yunnanensis]